MKIVRLLILIALGLNALAQVLYIFWDLSLLILATVFGAIFPDADTRVDSETAKHLAFLALSIAGFLVLDLTRTRDGVFWQLRSGLGKAKMAAVAVLLIGATAPTWPGIYSMLQAAQFERARLATPLLSAVKRGDVEVVQLRISQGADLEQRDESFYSWTPLFIAAFYDNPEIVAALIAAGADVNAQMDDGFTALMRGAANPDFGFDVVRLLLEAGADVDLRHDDGRTALIFGAQANGSRSADAARLLLEAGANIDAQPLRGTSTLMWASGWGHTATVQVLLEFGADVNLEDKDGNTALSRAVEREKHEIVELLKAAGATR